MVSTLLRLIRCICSERRWLVSSGTSAFSLGPGRRNFLTAVVLMVFLVAPANALATPALQENVYVVQRGDTLSKIAIRMGVSRAELVRINNIANPNFVWVGQRLIIPDTGYPEIPPATQPSPGVYVVQPGDTLASIALRYGVGMTALAQINGVRNINYIWVGQLLTIPGAPAPQPGPKPGPAPTPEPTPQPTPRPAPTTGTYVVQPRDMLAGIAAHYGTTVAALVAANGLPNPDYIWVGQRLKVGTSGVPLPNPAPQPAPQPAPSPGSGRWIDVNLSQQRLTAYEGSTPIFSTLISGGLAGTPTVIGRFAVQTKLTAQTMSGPGYWLPNVPYVMYFYGGYAIHGTYWHNNFGQPMSHGCVNMTTTDAAWLFSWASIGTSVVTHW